MKNLPYDVYIDKKQHWAAEYWCRERFGKRWSVTDNKSGIWSCFWAGSRGPRSGMYVYSFANEEDAILFTLRWS